MFGNDKLGEHFLADHCDEVVFADFEFRQDRGERPRPICLVFKELRSGRVGRHWRDELVQMRAAPFDTGPRTCFVAYAAAAEVACMIELGWKSPRRIIDLFFEHRTGTNGLYLPMGNGLIGALDHRGLPHMRHDEKDAMRGLAMTRDNFTDEERAALLKYCEEDVDALVVLFTEMAPSIDWPRALFRGRYAPAVAHVQRHGIQWDVELSQRLRSNRPGIKAALIESVDADFGVFTGGVLTHELLARYLAVHGIPWPRTASGRLKLDRGTLKEMARRFPTLEPLRQLKLTLDVTRSLAPPLGTDGRVRCSVKPFWTITGRNQPDARDFAFAYPKWERSLIKPHVGWGGAYIDYKAQEIGIAAGLSGDERMIEHYLSGDCYLEFGKAAGLAPPDATAATHALVRAMCKALLIGANYGMTAEGIAESAAISRAEGAELLRLHYGMYRPFWRWNEGVVTQAMLTSRISTQFGFEYRLRPDPNPRSIANWPMQAHGGEMLRAAAIAGTEAGIEIGALVHDAIWMQAPLDVLDEQVSAMRALMTRAGRAVAGIDIGTDVKVVRSPNRFMADGAQPMFDRVMGLLQTVEAAP